MEPWVPSWVEVRRGAAICQHCIMDASDLSAVAVMLGCFVAVDAAFARIKILRMAVRRGDWRWGSTCMDLKFWIGCLVYVRGWGVLGNDCQFRGRGRGEPSCF